MPRVIHLVRELKISYDTIVRFVSSRFGLHFTSVNDRIEDDIYLRIIQRYGMDKAFRREIRRELGTIQHVRLSPVEKLMAKRRRSRKNSKGQSTVWTAIGKSTHIHFVNVPFGGKGRR